MPVGLLGLLQDGLKDLALNILLQLLAGIAAAHQPVVQPRVVRPQDQDQVEPALGEDVRDVVLEYEAASLLPLLQQVQQFVLIQLVALVLIVPLSQAGVLLNIGRNYEQLLTYC
jgi:hypothetical protein